jgi:hypothetical protein
MTCESAFTSTSTTESGVGTAAPPELAENEYFGNGPGAGSVTAPANGAAFV